MVLDDRRGFGFLETILVIGVLAVMIGGAFYYSSKTFQLPPNLERVNSSTSTTSTFKFTNVSSGIVRGKVSVGPICPVEREGVPCPVPSETYTSRKAIVYKSDKKTIVQEKNLNPDGTYEFSLSTGEYYVNVIPQGIGTLPPKKVVIEKNKVSQLDFDIDTGIR